MTAIYEASIAIYNQISPSVFFDVSEKHPVMTSFSYQE